MTTEQSIAEDATVTSRTPLILLADEAAAAGACCGGSCQLPNG